MKFEYLPGATPLDLDEISGLIPYHITTQSDLNEWEAVNILKAENWAFSSVHRNILTLQFIRLLHRKMFEDTWKWAGIFRKTEKNIGVEPVKISIELKKLLDDVAYQIINHSFAFKEIAYRFHHRLVSIHPFSNGNGRHARTMTDLLLTQFGHSRFTWGRQRLQNPNSTRKQYIDALRDADRHDYQALAKFVHT